MLVRFRWQRKTLPWYQITVRLKMSAIGSIIDSVLTFSSELTSTVQSVSATAAPLSQPHRCAAVKPSVTASVRHPESVTTTSRAFLLSNSDRMAVAIDEPERQVSIKTSLQVQQKQKTITKKKKKP